ncbi:MAG: YegP family protein [Bacteroidota bacterium]
MGKFVISKRTNGEFQFNLKAGNGQVILTSEGYAAKSGCENGIESVKKNSQDDSKFDRKTASNGKFYFNLLAGNGQIIGSSQMYEAEAGRDNGIDSVKENAPTATTEDETV